MYDRISSGGSSFFHSSVVFLVFASYPHYNASRRENQQGKIKNVRWAERFSA
jgi:hypothetical protein